ncbi:hypothetical protein TNCV_355981 [Trichonephila clavipes]|nr:hypothetical protein TNCV_355981 [Trichonephila clavipes]
MRVVGNRPRNFEFCPARRKTPELAPPLQTITPICARVRSETQAELQAARRAIETPEQSQARKIHNAEMQSSRRRNFIRKDWSVFNGTRFQYDASVEYHNHPLIVIG